MALSLISFKSVRMSPSQDTSLTTLSKHSLSPFLLLSRSHRLAYEHWIFSLSLLLLPVFPHWKEISMRSQILSLLFTGISPAPSETRKVGICGACHHQNQ